MVGGEASAFVILVDDSIFGEGTEIVLVLKVDSICGVSL